jgi:hypothetical protein
VFEAAHFLDHLGDFLHDHEAHFHTHHDHTHPHPANHHHDDLSDIMKAVVEASEPGEEGTQHPGIPVINRTIDTHNLSLPQFSLTKIFAECSIEDHYAFTITDVPPPVDTPPPKL